MSSDISLLIDIIFKIGILALGFAALAVVMQGREAELNEERKKCRERISELKNQVEEYRQRITELSERHKAELEQYAKMSKMLLELKNAIEGEAVKLTCSEHGTDVILLADGTIVCDRGHRVWPRGEEA